MRIHERGFDIYRHSTFENKKVPCEFAYINKYNKLVIRLPFHQLTNEEALDFAEWIKEQYESTS